MSAPDIDVACKTGSTKGGSLGESIEQFMTRANRSYMSDTPRTDAVLIGHSRKVVEAEFARMLEREIANKKPALLSELEGMISDLSAKVADWGGRYAVAADELEQWKRQAFEMQAQRDELRKALDEILELEPADDFTRYSVAFATCTEDRSMRESVTRGTRKPSCRAGCVRLPAVLLRNNGNQFLKNDQPRQISLL